MKLHQIVTGVLSGYASKAVALLASVAVVPFLLDPSVLGVEEYGRAYSILAVVSVIGIACAGIHLAADRAIARAVGRSGTGVGPTVAETLGSTSKVLWLVNLVLVVPLALFEESVLAALGFPNDSRHRFSLLAAVAIVFAENALYPLRAPLLARGDIAFVNLVGLAEVIGRTAATFALFSAVSGTVVALLSIQAVFTVARQVAFLLRLDRSDLAGVVSAPIASAVEAVRYSGPVSLAEGSVILIRNLPVMVASRFLGPTEAGYVAIVANTLQGYFLQVFYSVVQPIALPIASRFSIIDRDSARSRLFTDVESAYVLGVSVVFGWLIFWTPAAIPLWLGDGFEAVVLPTQIMLAGSGIQTGSIIRRSVLIGQGAIAAAVPAIVGSAGVSAILIVLGVALLDSWLSSIVASSLYLVASSVLGIDRNFVRRFPAVGTSNPFSRLLGVGAIFGCAVLVGRMCSPDDWIASAAWSIVSLGVSVVLGFATILSARRTIDLVDRLYRSRGVELFE